MAKMIARREEGLCYHCDEIYAPGHKYKSKHIYIMITEEEEQQPQPAVESDQELALVLQGEEGELLHIKENCGVSIHAVTGTNGIHTIKLTGQIKNKEISMLLDSGSTHNFILDIFVKKMPVHYWTL